MDQNGFTLIEIIVVVVIMGLIGTVVLVRQPWHSAGFDTDVTVRTLTSTLRLARSRAIAQDREVAVVTNGQDFALDGAPPRILPAGENLSAATIVFMPDGGSSGGTIVLGAGNRRIALSVNWLTGRVLSRPLAEQ